MHWSLNCLFWDYCHQCSNKKTVLIWCKASNQIFIKSAWWCHFLLWREEEECATAKYLKQAESPACTRNRTYLCTSSQFHNLRPHNTVLPSYSTRCERLKLTTQERLSALPDSKTCYPCLTVRGPRSLSNSWTSPWLMHSPYPTNKPLTQLFCSYFHSCFTHTLATTFFFL